MHGHGFDAGAVLRRRIDAHRPSTQVHGATGAGRAHLLVRHGSHGQFRQLKDLAGLGDGVVVHFQVANSAVGCPPVNNGFIDVRALT